MSLSLTLRPSLAAGSGLLMAACAQGTLWLFRAPVDVSALYQTQLWHKGFVEIGNTCKEFFCMGSMFLGNKELAEHTSTERQK